jgi:tetratricopeptide (TPR) repeat protein
MVVLAGYGWWRAELARAGQEIGAGRSAAARARLERLAALGLGGTESRFWLGACEQAEGHIEGALALWASIPRTSARYAAAALSRARLAFAQGRFAEVEAALEPAYFPPDSLASAARAGQLRDVYFFTGRYDDVRRRMDEEWATASNKAEMLRAHWQLDEPKAAPLRGVRARLEESGRLVPEDDRVWLGKAYLAIRMAHFDEAADWLQKCVRRRPEDPAVWRAQLEWALAAQRLALAIEALRHLPTDRLEPEQLLRLRAWLAARVGSQRAEQAALTELLDRVPGDTQAVSRLTELAVRSGDGAAGAALRRRKAELDQVYSAYRTALFAGLPTSHFEELGRLAEALGRWFEARGWWTLALRDPAHAALARTALARLDRSERVRAERDRPMQVSRPQTAADALSDLIPIDLQDRTDAWSPETVPIFHNDADAAGLRFVYENDPTPLWRMPESLGGGVGLIDYDGDGWLDVYAVGGGKLADEPVPPPVPQQDRLFRNRGDGTFEDVTASVGLLAFPGGYGHGVAVGDYDNDGHPDLFVTRWRSYALYRNRGDGTLEDRTAAAGLSGSRDWPMSAAFADLDGDGDLDLYVCHYVDWDAWTAPRCPHPYDAHRSTYCGPRRSPALPDHVFRNDGGRFSDISTQAGISAADRDGRGLGVVAAHLDDDERMDLFVANDLSANFLFYNRGGLRFEEAAAESGVAANADGRYLAGMGIACGDLDGDGRLDLAVTNYYSESTTFYQNLGAGQFVDHSTAVGLAAPSRYLLGFGAAFFDADNDGYLDLTTANGHVNDLRPDIPFAMPAQLLLGGASGRLVDVSARAGPPWLVPRLGRGLACGDLDNDGRLDLLIVDEGAPLAYFHNQGPAGHFVTFRLEGSVPGSNGDAVGARVTLRTGDRRQVAERIGGGSYLSAGDHRLHFGLGSATRVDSVEVRWPSGRVDRYTGIVADTGYLLREGQPRPNPLPGWQRRASRHRAGQ